ncbi:hypothetical protein, partial [Klebsiella pneumoniae]|uniref:hypothetical protein n=1 Tax=Klebsiella pneumoniae TaxID=573 RepID=UPI001F4A6E35
KGFINDIKTRKSQLLTANSYDGQADRSLVAATKSNQVTNISPKDPMVTRDENEITNAQVGKRKLVPNVEKKKKRKKKKKKK